MASARRSKDQPSLFRVDTPHGKFKAYALHLRRPMSAAILLAPGISALAATPRTRPTQAGMLGRGLANLIAWAGPGGYRPGPHYMRGGMTEGSRSLTLARAQIAGRA